MVVSQPRSPEPPRSTRRGRGACPWSSRERTSKARTAFLVAPLARVGGEYIGLDGPTLISTCCHSALAARAATGASTVSPHPGAHVARLPPAYSYGTPQNLEIPLRASGAKLWSLRFQVKKSKSSKNRALCATPPTEDARYPTPWTYRDCAPEKTTKRESARTRAKMTYSIPTSV